MGLKNIKPGMLFFSRGINDFCRVGFYDCSVEDENWFRLKPKEPVFVIGLYDSKMSVFVSVFTSQGVGHMSSATFEEEAFRWGKKRKL